MNKQLSGAAFVAGLIVLVWVGVGYASTNALALAMTALIAAFYVMGGLELRRFHQASTALAQALEALATPPASLADWLATLPAPLQNAVRLRVEGERVALPGPAMTPFLVGLLVLLGMLGTFLGMVVTLGGAVQALEGSADLSTMRAALTAPVKGLGLAFGTSVAGVATSAMLGLVSALCRRERVQVGQLLDGRIATVLRGFSQAHQREETLKQLQAQARVLPAVVDQLQAMMAQMAQQGEQLSAQLQANQQGFHQHAQGAYSALAASVDQSLQRSLSESARLAGASLQPVVEATMAGITRETSALHARVADTVQQQLDGLSRQFGHTVQQLAQGWDAAMARQDHSQTALTQGLHTALQGFNQGFEERASALLASVASTQAALQSSLQTTLGTLTQDAATLHGEQARSTQAQLEALASQFSGAAQALSAQWAQALRQQADGQAAQAAANQATLDGLAQGFSERASHLLATVDQAHGSLHTQLAARDEARLEAWQQSLSRLATGLAQTWAAAGAQAATQQQQICQTLERTAQAITAQSEAHARATIGEIGQLMQAATEAPRVAAEVIAQLRQQLSASIATDTAMLAERNRLMTTLASLLDTVRHASTEQRGAIDSLLGSTAQLLDQVGQRFNEQTHAASTQLGSVAAQLTGSAVEVASLGEAFGQAVQQFSSANEQMLGQLARIEAALDKSSSRSDEQLAYYVAQAREVIDLSILSQQQIVEDLQRLAQRPAALAGEVA